MMMMMSTKLSTAFTFILLLLSNVEAHSPIFDVTKYGTKANRNADISRALLSAWRGACASITPSTVVIPKGTYLLNAVSIQGPCRAPINVRVEGTLKAPPDPTRFKADQEWVNFQYIDNLVISGGGTFDGQGAIAWDQNDCHKTGECSKLPNNLSLNFLTNTMIQDITTLDSKLFHVNVLGCKNLTFLNFSVTAPQNSPNTDGIHIGRSSGINITDSTIKTGDDCVSIGDGAQQVRVTNVTCGPGHGISVGSLGKMPNEQDINGIFVMNCTLTNTTNGVRIKTWPTSHPGVATDMHFKDIIMDNVGNPVIIDQEYCPSNECIKNVPSKVKISKVSFKNIRGTSSSQIAVKLDCSQSNPCEKVEIGDIELTYNGEEGVATTQCTNVKPTFSGKQNPPICVHFP